MKNKILVFLAVLVTTSLFNVVSLTANSPIRSSANNTGWIEVSSYNGREAFGIFALYIDINGLTTNHPLWSLNVRVNAPITNNPRREIPPAKVRIRLNRVEKGPSIEEMSASRTAFPLAPVGNDITVIKNSTSPLKTLEGLYYRQFLFYFDILVEGGSYLKDLRGGNNYNLGLTFTLVDGDNKFLSEARANVDVGIKPPGGIPDPTYSLEINSNARNGLLEMNGAEDFERGVSQTYRGGLSIVSNTSYDVQVRTLSPNFESGSNTLPVDVVSVELRGSQNSAAFGSTPLSVVSQTVLTTINSDEKPHLFDIRYFTKPNDSRLFNAIRTNYNTTLLYTLVPH